MADLARAVQTAIYEKLLAANLALPIVSIVPDGMKPPAAVIAESVFEEIGGKTMVAERHQIVVRTFLGGTSKAPLLDTMTKIKDALHRQALTAAGVIMSNCEYLSGAERRDLEEGVLIGEQTFLIFAQPA